MENEKIYVKGLNTFTKNPNAPEFVLGKLCIVPNELIAWMKSPEIAGRLTEYNGQKQLRCDVVMGKDGKIKFTIDTWKPAAKEPEPTKQEKFNDPNDLPF